MDISLSRSRSSGGSGHGSEPSTRPALCHSCMQSRVCLATGELRSADFRAALRFQHSGPCTLRVPTKLPVEAALSRADIGHKVSRYSRYSPTDIPDGSGGGGEVSLGQNRKSFRMGTCFPLCCCERTSCYRLSALPRTDRRQLQSIPWRHANASNSAARSQAPHRILLARDH
jgi:hypothetical protein